MISPVTLASMYDEILEFMAMNTPEQILAFKPSESTQQRALELTGKNKLGTLTPDERTELNHMLEFERRLMALKAKAMESLE